MNYNITTNKENGINIICQMGGYQMEIWEAKQIREYIDWYIESNEEFELNIIQNNIDGIEEFMRGGKSMDGKYKSKKALNIKNYPDKLKTWNGRCAYCNDILYLDEVSLDHIIPESIGGTDEENNINFCCKFCNSSKGTKSVDKFIEYIKPYVDRVVFDKKDLKQYYKFKKLEEKYGKK